MNNMPPDLGAAIATGPAWLQAWIMLLGVVNLAAIAFVAYRHEGRWALRPEPPAILAAFIVAGLFMTWMYGQFGYVRLLGLAHLVFWTPVYIWVLRRRPAIGLASVFGVYIHLYLLIDGISLAIDAIDVVRYLLGDGDLMA